MFGGAQNARSAGRRRPTRHLRTVPTGHARRARNTRMPAVAGSHAVGFLGPLQRRPPICAVDLRQHQDGKDGPKERREQHQPDRQERVHTEKCSRPPTDYYAHLRRADRRSKAAPVRTQPFPLDEALRQQFLDDVRPFRPKFSPLSAERLRTWTSGADVTGEGSVPVAPHGKPCVRPDGDQPMVPDSGSWTVSVIKSCMAANLIRSRPSWDFNSMPRAAAAISSRAS
jgi:hypothetical protein